MHVRTDIPYVYLLHILLVTCIQGRNKNNEKLGNKHHIQSYGSIYVVQLATAERAQSRAPAKEITGSIPGQSMDIRYPEIIIIIIIIIIRILASYDEVNYSWHKFLDTGAASGDYSSPAVEQLLNRNLNTGPALMPGPLGVGGIRNPQGSISSSQISYLRYETMTSDTPKQKKNTLWLLLLLQYSYNLTVKNPRLDKCLTSADCFISKCAICFAYILGLLQTTATGLYTRTPMHMHATPGIDA